MRKKKTDKKVETKEKKSRAKYECTTELGKILAIVNLVPPDADMPNAGKVIEAFTNEWLLQEQKTDVDLWSDIFDECFKDFAEETKINIFKDWFDKSAKSNNDLDRRRYKALLDAVIITYEEIYQTRKNIKLVIDRATELKKKETEHSSFLKPELKFSFPISRTGDEITVETTSFFETISTINLDRLRACEICSRIFWANYKNSFTCSKPCLNALRQRRHRKTNKEAINAKRRANYGRNKQLKQLKEKKNGTL